MSIKPVGTRNGVGKWLPYSCYFPCEKERKKETKKERKKEEFKRFFDH